MEIQKENKMGVMPVNKLLLSMSLPIMISMLVQALYNIVDSIFVAKISENALTAVSLAFPIQSLMIATATGTGVGVNAILSKSLGEKNFEKANRTAVNGVFLAVMSYILFRADCNNAFLPQPDFGCGNSCLWKTVPDHRMCGVHRAFCTNNIRTPAAVYRKNDLHNDNPGNGGNY